VLDPARRLLAEADLLEGLERSQDAAEFLIPEAQWLLAELLCNETGHARREAIGRRLSETGDPRPGVGVINAVPDIVWCDIPGGQVFIEEVGTYAMEPFRMAAYPVTYAQYEVFLNAKDGYHVDCWQNRADNLWHRLQREYQPGQQLRLYPNHPADSVSWDDATAFCRWLSARLGFDVRLPDEWEWQWAAQSARPDFAYPWGTEFNDAAANTDEARIGRTTAVGVYPKGRSFQGAYDLSGNLWEWCRNPYWERTLVGRDDSASRVVRGGSWSGNSVSSRAGSRGRFGPRSRNGCLGFRVVCESELRR
jgi:formylglycine-generating enzyme required for sulfatase activity